ACDGRNVRDRWLSRALELLTRAHERFFSDAYAVRFGSADEREDGEAESPAAVDQVVPLRAQLGKLLYDKPSFVVKAGSTVTIVFSNPNYMQHNLVIVKPGALDRVRDAAERLARERQAPEHQYIPDTEDVLFATTLVDPNRRSELTFVVPSTPGSYPFLCTFPGQGETLYGTMEVVAE